MWVKVKYISFIWIFYYYFFIFGKNYDVYLALQECIGFLIEMCVSCKNINVNGTVIKSKCFLDNFAATWKTVFVQLLQHVGIFMHIVHVSHIFSYAKGQLQCGYLHYFIAVKIINCRGRLDSVELRNFLWANGSSFDECAQTRLRLSGRLSSRNRYLDWFEWKELFRLGLLLYYHITWTEYHVSQIKRQIGGFLSS